MRTESDHVFDSSKFAELMLYIAHKCRNETRFGQKKLSKIIYYCDIGAFRRHLKPITGAAYEKMDEGPVPLSFYQTQRELVDQGKARIVEKPVVKYTEQRFEPIGSIGELSSQFSDEERGIVDEVIDCMREMTGSETSLRSHGEFSWRAAEPNGDMSYESSLIARADDPRYRNWLSERVA